MDSCRVQGLKVSEEPVLALQTPQGCVFSSESSSLLLLLILSPSFRPCSVAQSTHVHGVGRKQMWCRKADVEDNRESLPDVWKGHMRIHAWQKSAGSIHDMLALCASQKGRSMCLSAHILS